LPCRVPRRCVIGAVLLLLLACTVAAQPAAGSPADVQVKAAYLYKFGAFVRWPSSAANGNEFPICVLGRDPFGNILDSTIEGESLGRKKLTAVRISSAREATRCRIVFISSSEEGRLQSVIAELSQIPVLTVSDIPQFAERGGMIGFVLQNARVRFEVNDTSAQKSGLTLSSQLLKIATAVKHSEAKD
jgi:YfiR/HmsC-like